MPDANTAKIAALNDHARHTFEGCRVVVTRGIQAMADVPEVLDQVHRYDAFTPNNDPYGEHDFGAITYKGHRIFWKIDCYDSNLTGGSINPADPSVTARVMTVFLASEY